MKRSVIVRSEMLNASLKLGSHEIPLREYATTGLLALAIGPRGHGKTNAGLVMAEQLSAQGWISVLIDPEDEMASMYGEPVASPDELRERLQLRDQAIVVVSAKDATQFVPYGRAVLAAAEEYRKPLFVVVDEGQVFSATRKRKNDIGEAADIINEFAERGRKRALDFFVTAHRYTGSVHRSIFATKNLTLIGCQEDPTAWASLAPQFRAAKIDFGDLNALAPGEFYCFSRRGVEKVRMQMAEALKRCAPETIVAKRALPTTFTQWSRAMREIPTARLRALSDPVVSLLGAVAGLSAQQMLSGRRALLDELESRA